MTISVEVTAATVASVETLPASPIRLSKDLTVPFNAFAHYTDGTTVDVTNTASWSGDFTLVSVSASVDSTTLSALQVGIAHLYFASPGIPVQIVEVFVTEAIPMSFNVLTDVELSRVGQTAHLSTFSNFSDGSHTDLGGTIDWTSSDPEIVSIDQTLRTATALRPGTVTITGVNGQRGVTSSRVFTITGSKPMISAGADHACALLSSGRIKCWGANEFGDLGLGDTEPRGDQPGELGAIEPFVDLGRGVLATSVAAGYQFSCALLVDGRVKCWGYNGQGQLGVGDSMNRGAAPGEMGDALPAVNLGTNASAKAIAAGPESVCALLVDGRVKCWGTGSYIGLGDGQDRGHSPAEMGDALPAVDLGAGRTAKSISSGFYTTCAVLDDGSVKCWGNNNNGQLGLGDTRDRGDGPGEMGDALPVVDFGTGVRALRASGNVHSCAITTDHRVKCWGRNLLGELGLGDSRSRGAAPGDMGDALPYVDLGDRLAMEVATGGAYACAILDDGHVKCWGWGVITGLADGLNHGENPGSMGNALPAVDLGTNRTAKGITAGANYTCVLLDDDSVKCWGVNDAGTLGNGDTTFRGRQASEMGDALPAVDLTPCPFDVSSDASNCRLVGRVCASGTCTNGTCCVPAPSGLVAWWRGEKNASDQTHAHDGTIEGNVSYVPGAVGSAFAFNRSGVVRASAVGMPLGSADRTLAAWVKIDVSSGNEETFFGGYGSFGTSGGSIGLGALGNDYLFASQGVQGVGGTQLSAGVWHHIAFTSAGAWGTLFADGTIVGSGSMPVDTGAGDFFIGGIGGDSYRQLTGAVDEMTVFDRALTGSEISAIHSAGSDGMCR